LRLRARLDGQPRQRHAKQDRKQGDTAHQQEAVEHCLDGRRTDKQLPGPRRVDLRGFEQQPRQREDHTRRNRASQQRQAERAGIGIVGGGRESIEACHW